MKCILYHNTSDEKVMNKRIIKIEEVDVEYIEDTSVNKPTFILSVLSKYPTANYIWVNDFGRYYYIRNKTLSQNRAYIECETDVLHSFYGEIKELEVVTERMSTKANFYLHDDKIKNLSYPYVETHSFTQTKGEGFNKNFDSVILAITGVV